MVALPVTFWQKVNKTDTCWEWVGAKQSKGYGSFFIDGTSYLVHRLAYMDSFGEIPRGLVVDHLCCYKPCVRPAHLEAVTIRENNWRAYLSTRRYCPEGHEMTFRWRDGHTRQERYCFHCENARRELSAAA